jgi:hypothetical protein
MVKFLWKACFCHPMKTNSTLRIKESGGKVLNPAAKTPVSRRGLGQRPGKDAKV